MQNERNDSRSKLFNLDFLEILKEIEKEEPRPSLPAMTMFALSPNTSSWLHWKIYVQVVS